MFEAPSKGAAYPALGDIRLLGFAWRSCEQFLQARREAPAPTMVHLLPDGRASDTYVRPSSYCGSEEFQ